MRKKFKLFFMLCLLSVSIHAQDDRSPSLNIGDPAPAFRLREWLKGSPIKKFEKDQVYVVEFWATWCAPCRAAMPQLSALSRQYNNRVTFIGINVMERKTTSMDKIRAFVDSMGQRMDYYVAVEDSNYMVADWMEASGERGIPSTFVVNAEGRLAWIGHPKNLLKVLPLIVNNTWNIKEATGKRIIDKRLRELDLSVNYDLMDYWGKPDSALLAISGIVRREPKLKYAPLMAYNTFCRLLETNLQKAYEYGKVVLVTPTYEEPAYNFIVTAIEYYSDKMNLSTDIYRLGAEAYKAQIDNTAYPELHNMAKSYNKMAEWYGCSNQKLNAIGAQEKAIEALKSKKDFSHTEMAVFQARLQQYKNN